MIIIQQATYGEVQGKTSGHDLLAVSNEKSELFRRVSSYTDLADRPEGGVLSAPVVRGFFAEDHFLLIKTFPDKSPGLRSGRVFAHALFIPKSDLLRVSNLNNLFQYHLPAIQKEAELSPLEYNPQELKTKTKTVSGKEAAAINALVNNEQFVWLGKEGYWEWMTRIWPQLPTGVKHKLKFGVTFNPSYIKTEYLNLHYILDESKPLWERHSFRVINSGETETLQSTVAHWLMGNTENAAPFQTLIDDFAPNIDSFETIKQLHDYGKAYYQIGKEPKLNHLLVLADFVSQISPNERVGVKGKNRLMTAILQAISNAPVYKFTALKYQSWKGFPDAMTSASDAVRDWLTNNMLQGRQAKKCGVVLVTALEAETKNWWVNTVLDYLNNRLKKRDPNDPPILWQWMKNETELIVQHASWLPDDAENELAAKIPQLENAVAEAVLQMAEQKDWLVLHAKVAAQCYSAEKAIQAQLRIDTNEDHTVALEALSISIKGSAFVPVAVDNTDARLHHIAGKMINKNSKLLKNIDITSEGWQQCWEAAIEQGNDVWSGISNPQRTLFKILDHMLTGNAFSKTLLQAMSISKHCSLKDYPKRASIWQEIPSKSRSGFITATLVELIDELVTGQLHYNDLETELKKGIQSQEVQNKIIESKTIPLTKKILLFDLLPGLGEYHAQQLISDNLFSLQEAKEFGRLVSKKRWEAVINKLYNYRLNRKDLVPALLQCSHLLGIGQRFSLMLSGLKHDAVTHDEWWNTFRDVACKTYPEGPNEKGLWDRAGGDLSQLSFGATGRKIWVNAIIHVRNDGNPPVENLIAKMLEDHPRNEILLKLKKTL